MSDFSRKCYTLLEQSSQAIKIKENLIIVAKSRLDHKILILFDKYYICCYNNLKLRACVYTRKKARARREFGLSVVPDTSRGLFRRFCKDVCRAYGGADNIYGSKVFAKAHSQVFFCVCDCGDLFCVVQKLHSAIDVLHGQSDCSQRHDRVLDGSDHFVFRLRCDLYCAKRVRSFVFKRAQRRQVRFSHRKELCATQRRHLCVGGFFAHLARLYTMK